MPNPSAPPSPAQRLAMFALTVRDYDEAIAFYVGTLGFTLLEDTDRGNGKRWVRIAPPGSHAPPSAPQPGAAVPAPHQPTAGAEILLAKATTPEQLASVGNQTGGWVFLFLETNNIKRDFALYTARGVTFTGPLREEDFGTVTVFRDLYGNLWDLIEPR